MKPQIFRVVFEDEDLLVIEKQQSFLSQRADSGQGEGLDEFISRTLNRKVFPVHRLDREVTGLMIYGRNPAAAESLSRSFKERTITKIYEAEVAGRVFKDQDTLVHYLKKNPKNNHVTVFSRPTPDAKKAELSYQVLERLERSTRILIHLKTGRTHQIRVQLAKIGHPILGDNRYSKTSAEFDAPHTDIRLRAVYLAVTHPKTGEVMSWSLIDQEQIEMFLSSSQ